MGPRVSFVDAVKSRLQFAERRLRGLCTLNGANLGGAPADERAQLVMEYFFHLVGGVDFLAQAVNGEKDLGGPAERVRVKAVCDELPDGRLKSLLQELHPAKGDQPNDLTRETGTYWRIVQLRDHLVHRGENPFVLEAGDDAFLLLDAPSVSSRYTISPRAGPDDLAIFLDPIWMKCKEGIALL